MKIQISPLKYERVIRGVRQCDLAAAVGIHFTLLSQIEAGRRLPKPEDKKNLAKALGVPIEKLFPKGK